MDSDEPPPPGEENEPLPPGVESQSETANDDINNPNSAPAAYQNLASTSYAQTYPASDAYPYGYYSGVDPSAQAASTAWQDYYNYYGSYGTSAPGYDYAYDSYYGATAHPSAPVPPPEPVTDTTTGLYVDSSTQPAAADPLDGLVQASSLQVAELDENEQATQVHPLPIGEALDGGAEGMVAIPKEEPATVPPIAQVASAPAPVPVGPSPDMLAMLQQRLAEFPQLASKKTQDVEPGNKKKKTVPLVMLKGAKLVVSQQAKAADKPDQHQSAVPPNHTSHQPVRIKAQDNLVSISAPTSTAELRPNHDVLRRHGSPPLVSGSPPPGETLRQPSVPRRVTLQTSPKGRVLASPDGSRSPPISKGRRSRSPSLPRFYRSRSRSPARYQRSVSPPGRSKSPSYGRRPLRPGRQHSLGLRGYRHGSYEDKPNHQRHIRRTRSPSRSSDTRSGSPKRHQQRTKRVWRQRSRLHDEGAEAELGDPSSKHARLLSRRDKERDAYRASEEWGSKHRIRGKGAYKRIADENERWQLDSGSPVEDGAAGGGAATNKLTKPKPGETLRDENPFIAQPPGKALFPIQQTAAPSYIHATTAPPPSALPSKPGDRARPPPQAAGAPQQSSYAKMLEEDSAAVRLRDKYLQVAETTLGTASMLRQTHKVPPTQAEEPSRHPPRDTLKATHAPWNDEQEWYANEGGVKLTGDTLPVPQYSKHNDDTEEDRNGTESPTAKAKKNKKEKKRKKEKSKEKKTKSKRTGKDVREAHDDHTSEREGHYRQHVRGSSGRAVATLDEYANDEWEEYARANDEMNRGKRRRQHSKERGAQREAHRRHGPTDVSPRGVKPEPHPSPSTSPQPMAAVKSEDVKEASAEAAKLAQAQAVRVASMQMTGMNLQLSRHARRIYVGNLPPSISEVELTQLFNNLMFVTNATVGPGLPIISCYMNPEKRFAFLEFRSVEETSNAMAFDGVGCRGETLKVRRPHDFNPQSAALMGPIDPSPHLNLAMLAGGGVDTAVPDGPNKLFVGGLPNFLSEERVKELLQSFGALKAFSLVMDWGVSGSTGYALFEYADPGVIDAAIQGLSSMQVGGKQLVVQQTRNAAETVSAIQSVAHKQQEKPAMPAATKVLRLSNMMERDELLDEEEYEDIVDDISSEISKYGSLSSVIVPKPAASIADDPPGVGKVYVQFDTVEGAKKAQSALNGRKFGEHAVDAVFYDEERFAAKNYD